MRVDAGMVVRQGPDDSSSSVHIIASSALLEVQEQQQSWYRLRLPPETSVTTGWLRLEDGTARQLRVTSVWQVPRPSRPVSEERLALARQHLSPGWQERHCGSYPLLTDVVDGALLAACDRLASSLDGAYQQRYGVSPLGRGGEAIILFRRLESFRDFVRAEGSSTVGYAGHASASRGYLVMYAGSQDPEDIAATLVHELSHLVSWRALGGPLPRWLSEGLADGLGDTATMQGIRRLEGVVGAEAEAQRLRQAVRSWGLPSSEELARLEVDAFDAAPQDRHYEHSALLVRFLLLDDSLAPSFRLFLNDLAAGSPYQADRLQQRLGITWQQLDRRFAAWFSRT